MKALLMVDIQNDFLPGGALEVTDGDKIIDVVNQLQQLFDLVVATQDWHPRNHMSFASSYPGRNPGDHVRSGGTDQILWPDHCVQGTSGAELSDALDTERVVRVIRKGTDPNVDSYSGFFDNQRNRATGLDGFLKKHGIKFLIITGLAADVCVKFTALDALALGYEVYLVEDATKAVGGEKALQDTVSELSKKGVHVVRSEELVDFLG